MNEIMDEYNNKCFLINIFDKNYNAKFYIDEGQLRIKLLDLVDIGIANKLKKRIKIVNGKIDDKIISIFNVESCSMTNISDNDFEVNFRFCEFIENYRFTNKSNRKIKNVTVIFYNINEFIISQFYNLDKHMNPLFNHKCYNYKFIDKNISVCIGSDTIFGTHKYENKKIISINFAYKKCQKYMDVLNDIWIFKAFLGIISKREIGIKKIELADNNVMFLNFIKFKENEPLNEWLAHNYKEFVLTLETIDNNFCVIYDNFNKLFRDSLPIFDVYLNTLRYETSNLNRFLNYTQILEYISKNYDDKNAYDIWIKNGKPSGKVTLSDRIESILSQVAYTWKFDDNRIYKLSRRIANGRNYYNHHTDELKKLSNEELFRIPYFLEDVILAYIYQYIDVDKSKIKLALQYNIFYDKKFLTKFSNKGNKPKE